MRSVTSADGTLIAYEQQGSGPALIVIDGAMSTRGSKAALRALLAPQLTVFGYDRRGRGDSGDTLPYAADREIDDIQALIEVAGGTAALYATPPARRSRWTRRYSSVTASPGLPYMNRLTRTTQPPGRRGAATSSS
jgi:hypothetical protein